MIRRIQSIALLATALSCAAAIPDPSATPHPRVLLNAAQKAIIQRNIATDEKCAQAWLRITDWNNLPDGGRLPANGDYRELALKIIAAQALVYALENDDATGRKAIQNLLDFHAAVNYPVQKDVTRAYGFAIYNTALVYDWCYPLLTAAEKQTLIQAVKTTAGRMEIGWPPVRQSNITGHSGEAQLLRDLLSAGIAFYNEDPETYTHSANRLFNQLIPPRNFFYAAHRHHQGSAYGPYRFHWEVFSSWLFKRMNGTNIYSPDQQFVPYSWIYGLCPNGEELIEGDSAHGGDSFRSEDRFLPVSMYYRDPILKRLALDTGVVDLARSTPVEFLLFYDPTFEAADTYNELPLTRFFTEPLGGMIARTGWGNGIDSETAVIKMEGAGYYFGNHDHLDGGVFQIFYKGHLATDTGIYGGGSYGSPFDWSINKRSIAHCTLLAFDPNEQPSKGGNDGGQIFPNHGREPQTLEELLVDYKNGSILAHDFGPNRQRPFYSTMSVDLTKAYGEKVKTCQRDFVVLNLDCAGRPAALLVFDRMETADPAFQKSWMFQSLHPAELCADGFTVMNDNSKLVCSSLLPTADNLAISQSGGPDDAYTVRGKSYPSKRTNEFSNGWRIQLAPKKAQTLDRFLNVMQIMDADTKEPLPVTSFSTEQFAGAVLDNWCALFPIGDAVESATLALPVENLLLTGLEPGDWWISQNNRAEKYTVTSEAKTLFRKGSTGTVQLTRIPPADCTIVPTKDCSNWVPQDHEPSGPRIYLDGELLPAPDMISIDGALWIQPESLLCQCNAEVSVSESELKATWNGRTLSYRFGEPTYFVNGEPFALSSANGDRLPLQAVAAFLQKRCEEKSEKIAIIASLPITPWYERIIADHAVDGHSAIDAADGDPKTYWAAEGLGNMLTIDLGKSHSVSGMRLTWYRGDSRKTIFELLYSVDGQRWKPLFNGESSGTTTDPETLSFTPVTGRFIRLIGKGNTSNGWTSLCEAEVILPNPTESR